MPSASQAADVLGVGVAIVLLFLFLGVSVYFMARYESVKVALVGVAAIFMLATGIISFPDAIEALVPFAVFVVIFGGVAVLLVAIIGVTAISALIAVAVEAVQGLSNAISRTPRTIFRSSKSFASKARRRLRHGVGSRPTPLKPTDEPDLGNERTGIEPEEVGIGEKS